LDIREEAGNGERREIRLGRKGTGGEVW